jgi:hypothetical protein
VYEIKETVVEEWWCLLPIINPLTFYFIDSINQAVRLGKVFSKTQKPP